MAPINGKGNETFLLAAVRKKSNEQLIINTAR
jgi:hypothetical protein